MTRHHGTLPQLLPVPDRFAESQHILAAWQAGQSRLQLKQKKRAAGPRNLGETDPEIAIAYDQMTLCH